MLQCVGAIDGLYIPILVINHTDYYNWKGWYSILPLTVSHVGWPGSINVYNTRVYKKEFAHLGT